MPDSTERAEEPQDVRCHPLGALPQDQVCHVRVDLQHGARNPPGKCFLVRARQQVVLRAPEDERARLDSSGFRGRSGLAEPVQDGFPGACAGMLRPSRTRSSMYQSGTSWIRGNRASESRTHASSRGPPGRPPRRRRRAVPAGSGEIPPAPAPPRVGEEQAQVVGPRTRRLRIRRRRRAGVRVRPGWFRGPKRHTWFGQACLFVWLFGYVDDYCLIQGLFRPGIVYAGDCPVAEE